MEEAVRSYPTSGFIIIFNTYQHQDEEMKSRVEESGPGGGLWRTCGMNKASNPGRNSELAGADARYPFPEFLNLTHPFNLSSCRTGTDM